ncbi:MAG: Tetratricopeptide repeat [Clostridiales bacterium]|jgi:hypothetical protein|nr:Tetratricopeptide repeat [Clostridiales bacterium]
MNHKNNFSGALLKLERLKVNKGQKEICQGICVVSYLSKIEHNQVNPDPEIMKSLFKRLGINYTADRKFVDDNYLLIDEYYQQRLYDFERCAYQELLKHDDKLKYSPLFLDWLLIKANERDEISFEHLRECQEYLNKEQLARFYMLLPIEFHNSAEVILAYEEANRILNNSASIINVVYGHMLLGNYDLVNNYASKGITAALDEGNTRNLANCYLLQGSAYASQNLDQLMMPYYQRAINLLTGTIWKQDLSGIYYNMGATFLCAEKYDKAYKYLNMVEGDEDGFLLNHKKALTLIRLGRIDETDIFLEKMNHWILANRDNEVEKLMYEETLIECQKDFIDNPIFVEVMEKLMKLLKVTRHKGYLIFYKKLLKEAYCRQRKYKKALELEEELS